MTTKHLFLAGIATLIFSCSEDDQILSPPPASDDVVFDYYTVDHTTILNSSANTSGSFLTGNLQNERFFSETHEQFLNGIGQGQVTTQHYFYENDLLVKRDYVDDVRYFFYDDEGNLVGLNWQYNNGPLAYYRFVHVSANTVYFERSSLPYNYPAAVGSYRIIIQFDEDDNIISAGWDPELDGVANNAHSFTYDAAGNLTTITQSNGSTTNISYSTIKDNFAKLAINTYGKKNLLIYQAECYAHLVFDQMRHSPNLRLADTQDNVIEVLDPPYYFRKTTTQTLDEGESTTVTTFYFD